MRQMMFGVAAGVIVVLFLGVFIALHGRSLRQNETEQSLESAMEHVMEQIRVEGDQAFADRDEFVAEFIEALLAQIDSDSEISVRVLKADEKKGLLSVEVVETYEHPNGAKGNVSAQRTMILDTAVDAY